jgi:hypothetical protein
MQNKTETKIKIYCFVLLPKGTVENEDLTAKLWRTAQKSGLV